jgi:glycosyltransferase involved in cell wall biosynthesis
MFLRVFFPDRLKSLQIESFVLANELPEKDRTKGTPLQADKIKSSFGKGTLFLMVGTIEPRKGHGDILSMMEHLWLDTVNSDLKLILIGKRGWEVSELINRIKKHKKNGKQLFWLENCSDEFLIDLYSGSAGLIVASRAEGYSLPIVESQNFKLPVFARDIPIYREIGQTYPGINYFSGESPEQIADEFNHWRRTIKQKNYLNNVSTKKICWEKATKDLEKIINE